MAGMKTAVAVALAAVEGASAFTAPSMLRGAPAASVGIEADVAPPVVAPKAAATSGTGLLAVGAVGVAAAALAGAGRRTANARHERRHVVAAQAGPKVLEGTGGPFGDDFWDPAGLANGKTDDELLYWRASELKHGRVAMLAVVGWFHVASGYHPIGDLAARVRVSDDPLINAQQLPLGGALQIFFTLMVLEWLSTFICKPPKSAPWDVLGWEPVIADKNYAPWKQTQLQELNNGRLAMIAIIGLISQDALTGDYFGQISTPCFGLPVCGDMNLLQGFQVPEIYPRSHYETPDVIQMREIVKTFQPPEIIEKPADLGLPYYLKTPGGFATLQVPPKP